MDDFRLIKMVVKKLEKDICNVNFSDISNDMNLKPYTTVLIGANGSGKTYLLKIICDIFKFLKDKLGSNSQYVYDYFHVEYCICNKIYKVEVIKNNILKCMCNMKEIPFKEILLPKKILAVSFMVNDKFLFSDNKNKNSMYVYLGVRKTSNCTYTSSLVRTVIDNIFIAIDNGKTGVIKDALKLMNMEDKISFEVRPSTNKSLKIINDSNKLREFLNDKINIKYKNKHRENEISVESLVEAINSIDFGPVEVDLGNKNGISNLIEFKREIDELIDFNLLKPIKIFFYKKKENISFEDCSSGEKHIIFAFSSIAVNIYPGSIILVDEPEISLHPNWQMKYIHLLKKTFEKYSSCHFILATHSHYIISDLEPDSSSVVILKKDDDNEPSKAELLEYSTYSWSADNIIYNVFGLRTARNYYFEMDLRDMIESMQSRIPDIKLIEKLYNKLIGYNYDKNDPLNKVLDEVEVYLDVHKTTD